jgi:hypothetical protein
MEVGFGPEADLIGGRRDGGLVRSLPVHARRSERPLSAKNGRPKTRPAVCIVFRYRLRLRKGRLPENAKALKILYFWNAPF